MRGERINRPYRFQMNIGRKRLPHDAGPAVSGNPEGEVYFITICCVPRVLNQLAHPEIWALLESTIEHREKMGDLACRLALAMPDHLHALMSFPGDKSMRSEITAIKSWVAAKAKVNWQRDFFDHRLRSWESGAEKANYIRMNPVRAGLVSKPEDWPFQR
jgi:putative transposase